MSRAAIPPMPAEISPESPDDGDGWDDYDLESARWLSRGLDRHGRRVIQRAIGGGRARMWLPGRVTLEGDQQDEYHETAERAERESRTQAEQRAKAAAARAAHARRATG
jgi:hypothetical protein